MRDIVVRRLDGPAAEVAVPGLAEVLSDCVAGGASVSFMWPMGVTEAEDFWREVARDVAKGDVALMAAYDGARLVGTVQVILAMRPNQQHRGEIAKMLVHRDARRRGVGAMLMRAVEDEARKAGKTLLTLDTVQGGDAERLYAGLGWTAAGAIPNYALFPDGRPCATVYYWKAIGAA